MAIAVGEVSVMYSYRVWGKGHSNELIITPETLAFVERWELFIDHWYEDGIRDHDTPEGPKGSTIWSCCFGHAEGGDNPPFKMTPGQTFTIEEGRALLLKDFEIKARYVRTRVKVPLTTYMYGGLSSMVYQYGQGRVDAAVEKEGLVFPALNNGQYVKAFTQMLKLNKKKDGTESDGHTLRRASEIGFLMHRID